MITGIVRYVQIRLLRRSGGWLLVLLLLAAIAPTAVQSAAAVQGMPAVQVGTYLGGSSTDSIQGVAVDAAGNLYVTGYTYSTNFPGASRPNNGSTDIFVTKLDARASAVLYTTILGGSDDDLSAGIAVDAAGNVWVTGETQSSDFPTRNPLHSADFSAGYLDTFVTKLNASGAIEFSTYLGVAVNDAGAAIALDMAGNAYVTGEQRAAFGPEIFVRKLAADGSRDVYSYVFGAAERGFEKGSSPRAIAVDNQGSAYITGQSNSIVFPVLNALQATCNEQDSIDCTGVDAFLTKLNPAGDGLIFSTYFGGSSAGSATGSGADEGWAVGVDALGYVTVAGLTFAPDFPVKNALQSAPGGADNFADSFVARFTPQGNALVYATYLGGSAWDEVHALTVDASGNAYLTGITSSDNFPVSANAPQPTIGPGICIHGSTERYCYDGFVTALDVAGVALWSSYLGGASEESANGIAHAGADIVIAGKTESRDFPTTAGSLQPSKALNEDGFVVRLTTDAATPLPPSGYELFIPVVSR